MRKQKDTLLLEQAYEKVLEDFNSERRLNAFSQNLQGRGFKQAYRDSTNNGEVHVFFNPKFGELIFVETDASKNFVDGYVLTTDSAANVVKMISQHTMGFGSLKELLDHVAQNSNITASEMHHLKNYEEAFQQIQSRDNYKVGV